MSFLSNLLPWKSRTAAPDPSPGRRFGSSAGNSRAAFYAQSAYRDTSYAGASRVRKQLSNWQPPRLSADADLLPDQDLLVARARDLNRNNGVASGALQTLQDNAVGVGLRLACAPDFRALGKDITWSEEWSRNVESLWRTWSECAYCDAAGKLNFASMTQLVFRSALENGEALALPLWMERQNTPYKTCMQLIDTDRLSNPGNTVSSVYLRGGIEIDGYGRPVAYHIARNNNLMGVFLPAWSQDWERIPAETPWGRKRVLHLHAQERVDQTRGKPILAPVIEQFRMLDSYQRTELQSSIVNSIVAGMIETPLDPAGLSEMVGGDPNAYLQAKSEYRVQLEGGTLIPLYPGDKLTPFTPARPAPQFAQFVDAVIRQIGTAVGLPYELIMKDFSKTNYSSARAALLEAWRFFTNRRVWLATYWAQPVYRLWLEEAVDAGLVDAPDYYENVELYSRAKWIGPGRGWIDPVKEAEAARIRMDTLISTLEMECAEQGLDWNEVLDQRALEIARMKELGLYTEPTPTITSTVGATSPEESGPGQQEPQQEDPEQPAPAQQEAA